MVVPGEPMPSLRERKKADTRTRLSAAAVELLVAEGVEGATVSAIAGRAGVSTRTFHNYFAHREDAFVHFLREQIAEFVRQVDRADADLTPVDIFRTMFRELYGRSSDDIEAADNLLVAGEQIGIMLSSDARSCIAEQILDPLYEAISRREPQLSDFRVRVLVDLSLAVGASVLRHRPRGGQAPDDAEQIGTDQLHGNGEQEALKSRAAYLDEAFDVLENGAGNLLRGDGRC